MNSTNLVKIDGGSRIKQSDMSSSFSYRLLDENKKRMTGLDGKQAEIKLVKGDVAYFTTNKTVEVDSVTFTIAETLPVGKYILEIKSDGYVFPSDKSVTIEVVQGADKYEIKELVPADLQTVSATLDLVKSSVSELKTKLEQLTDYDDTLLRSQITSISDDLQELSETVQSIEQYDDTQVRQSIQSLQSDLALLSQRLTNLIENNTLYDDTELREQIRLISEQVEQIDTNRTIILTEEQKAELKGEKGDKGERGSDGVNGINGIDGKDGINGIDGTNGLDGKSAYQIALFSGFSGTEQEWLSSLKGDVGEKGEQGVAGRDGRDALNSLLDDTKVNANDSLGAVATRGTAVISLSTEETYFTATWGSYIRLNRADALTTPLVQGQVYTASFITNKNISRMSYYSNASRGYLQCTQYVLNDAYLYTATFVAPTEGTLSTNIYAECTQGLISSFRLDKGSKSNIYTDLELLKFKIADMKAYATSQLDLNTITRINALSTVFNTNDIVYTAFPTLTNTNAVFSGATTTTVAIGTITRGSLVAGDLLELSLILAYTNIVPSTGTSCAISLSGSVASSGNQSGVLPGQVVASISGTGVTKLIYRIKVTSDIASNTGWTLNLTANNVAAGSVLEYKNLYMIKI